MDVEAGFRTMRLAADEGDFAAEEEAVDVTSGVDPFLDLDVILECFLFLAMGGGEASYTSFKHPWVLLSALKKICMGLMREEPRAVNAKPNLWRFKKKNRPPRW